MGRSGGRGRSGQGDAPGRNERVVTPIHRLVDDTLRVAHLPVGGVARVRPIDGPHYPRDAAAQEDIDSVRAGDVADGGVRGGIAHRR